MSFRPVVHRAASTCKTTYVGTTKYATFFKKNEPCKIMWSHGTKFFNPVPVVPGRKYTLDPQHPTEIKENIDPKKEAKAQEKKRKMDAAEQERENKEKKKRRISAIKEKLLEL